jgi:hypothetical protein
LNYNCSNLWDMRNLQEQVKKAFCYQKLFWPFTAWTNCSSDLKIFANSRPSASNFKSFSRSLEQFFLTLGQNNFGNKIPKMQHIVKESIVYHIWSDKLCLPNIIFSDSQLILSDVWLIWSAWGSNLELLMIKIEIHSSKCDDPVDQMNDT